MSMIPWKADGTPPAYGAETAQVRSLHRLILLTLYELIFLRGNINIYLPFVSFLHIDTTQVVEILLQTRQEPTYST